jgi:hypothetical protein
MFKKINRTNHELPRSPLWKQTTLWFVHVPSTFGCTTMIFRSNTIRFLSLCVSRQQDLQTRCTVLVVTTLSHRSTWYFIRSVLPPPQWLLCSSRVLFRPGQGVWSKGPGEGTWKKCTKLDRTYCPVVNCVILSHGTVVLSTGSTLGHLVYRLRFVFTPPDFWNVSLGF